jgi:hypothetical protein
LLAAHYTHHLPDAGLDYPAHNEQPIQRRNFQGSRDSDCCKQPASGQFLPARQELLGRKLACVFANVRFEGVVVPLPIR